MHARPFLSWLPFVLAMPGTATADPAVITCETLAPLASGTCTVTPGDASKLLRGDVLVPGTVYHGGQVAVDAAGRSSASAATARRRCPRQRRSVVRPA
jgi:hypothetical protein